MADFPSLGAGLSCLCVTGPDIGVPSLAHNEHGCLIWSRARGGALGMGARFISLFQ